MVKRTIGMKLITTSNTIEVIQEQEILYVEAYQNYSKIYLKNGKMILSKDILTELEAKLGPLFYRIHHSFIINIIHLKRYYKLGEVELFTKKVLPVARRRRAAFISTLMSTASLVG